MREAEWRHLDRAAGQKKGPGDGEAWPKATAHLGIIGGRGVDDIWSGFSVAALKKDKRPLKFLFRC